MGAMNTPPLGIIEGYYGRAWDWNARARVVSILAPRGYRFFIHAPKAARALRKGWREPVPEQELAHWTALARHARACAMQFGVGLSPHEFNDAPGHVDWALLRDRVRLLDDAVGIDRLALLFDDIRGDDPALATRQARVAEFVATHTRAPLLWVCPSYYSDDPVLDRVFGSRPQGYLESLGRSLDPAIGLFWTGEEVCSRAFDAAHLERVAEQMRRLPVLWDNYPVNDGARMSQRLHLRAFTGRAAATASRVQAHAINPASQPVLGCIAALTLAQQQVLGEQGYAYGQALRHAACEVLGEALAQDLIGDLIALQDMGLDALIAQGQAPELRARYARWSLDVSLTPLAREAATEVVDWLDGGWRITDEIVRTQ